MKVIKWLDANLEKVCCMILLAVFATILFIQVVMRYVFNNSLSWSEELARYLFIWMVFIGVSYGAKQMKHLKIDVFLNIWPKKIRPYIEILADILFLVFCVVIVVAAYQSVLKIGKLGSKSAAMEIPLSWIQAAPLVGYALTAIRQVQAIIFRFKQIKEGGAE